jgi:hypothetical protein
MTSAPDSDFQPLFAAEEGSCNDIGGVDRECDHERTPVDHRVVERSSVVVARVIATDHLASQVRLQRAGMLVHGHRTSFRLRRYASTASSTRRRV